MGLGNNFQWPPNRAEDGAPNSTYISPHSRNSSPAPQQNFNSPPQQNYSQLNNFSESPRNVASPVNVRNNFNNQQQQQQNSFNVPISTQPRINNNEVNSNTNFTTKTTAISNNSQQSVQFSEQTKSPQNINVPINVTRQTMLLSISICQV